MTWTHEGRPLGQPQRPWRLSRAQRVEMEARVAAIRADVTPRGVDVARTLHGSVLVGGHAAASSARAAWHRGELSQRDARILRARVAIAIRAALRADEDARCEEALRRAGYGEETGATPGDAWDDGYDSGARAAIDAMREWPDACAMYRDVPLALWETDERRRRETVRAVVALLTWGLS